MLVVVSPAKRLDWSERNIATTMPEFQHHSNRLAGHARQLSLGQLKSLMGLSDDLARLNRDRFRAFSDNPVPETTRAAIYAFAGDTYQGFDVGSLPDAALEQAQIRLRILSGLYGVLRPLDAIQPYRLEMGSRLKTRRGSNLYDYWGDEISKSLNRDAEQIGADVLVNCASQEYFGAVDQSALKLRVVTPQFFEMKNGTPKIVSFFAKKARGAMARFIVEHQISSPEELSRFEVDGYRFSGESDGVMKFIRHQQAAAI